MVFLNSKSSNASQAWVSNLSLKHISIPGSYWLQNHTSLPFNFQRTCVHGPGRQGVMNQAVIKRVTLWCFFKSIALFIVTLSHPRSEDFIAVALKSGFTSQLLHHSYVVEQGAGALSGHSASTEGYLCLSHLLFYSQQRKLSHYRILIS